ncbi:MAG: glutamate-5-semialdehyde dehydrogenase [Acidobacteriaceae bacterium]|jgi:glutamate-5-semialdehyde dehydrogenase
MSTAAAATVADTPVIEIARSAKAASRLLSTLPTAAKDEALESIATALEANAAAILAANAADVAAAEPLVRTGEFSQALFQRLLLSADKLGVMVEGVRAVRQLPDPSGRILERTLLADGLTLEKITVPLGVLAVIFEARPDAITQIGALAIKSGNAVILKGGHEVEHTMRAILSTIHSALAGSRVPANAVCGVYGRESVQALLSMNQLIDLVIPRGSNALVQYIQRNTLIPVLGHADGVCHIFIDQAADPTIINPVVVDSKTQYPAVCNAVETVLIHAAVAPAILPSLVRALEEKSVKIRGDARTRALLTNSAIDPVSDAEWHTEYSDLVLAIRIVDSLDDALDHIERYGSHHTDAILTQDAAAAARFLAEVDSANVLQNCSTRFSDGFRYGFGAEVGISTSKLHARGPVGLDGIVTYKYRLIGSGHIVRDYTGTSALPFRHQKLKVD